MALSAVEICNRALNAVGSQAITALDEATPRAEICRRLYEDCRNELIQDHPWNFAIKRADLAALSTTPSWGWDYQYTMPTDCLRVIEVEDEAQGTASWAVEGRNILTNTDSVIYIRYLSNDVSEVYFPPKFTAALVLRIAMDLAMPLTESGARREAIGKQYMLAIKSARGQDSREGGPTAVLSEDIITVGL